MMRAEDDTWDLASSVGATATMVAAARAVATRTADPLITDPFAEPLVRAVGVDFSTRGARMNDSIELMGAQRIMIPLATGRRLDAQRAQSMSRL